MDKDYSEKFDRMTKSAENLKKVQNRVKSKAEKEYKKSAFKPKDNFQKADSIVKTRRVAVGAKIGSKVLRSIGQKQYNAYKDNSSPGRTSVVKGLGHTSNVLNAIGNVAFVATAAKQYEYGKNYWRN